MKLLFLLLVIAAIGSGIYLFSSKWFHTKKKNRPKWKPLSITAAVVVVLLGLLEIGMYQSASAPDTQCTTHKTTSQPPLSLKTASDYFAQGNYDYDIGNCRQAVRDYTKAITLNPNYAQAYNNRAYTSMRMRNYKDALPDLDKAIALNPHYMQALMNRGDIHNYYYQIDRQAAIADYKKVIALTGTSGGSTSVCGHLFLAEHNGWTLEAYFDFFRGKFASCK